MSKTNITMASKIAASGIDHMGDDLWDDLGGLYPAVVLLEVAERTEPADEEGDRKAKLQVVGIEIPQTDTSRESLRQQLREMYARRTGEDSLFDHGDEGTTRDTEGRVTSVTFTSDDAAHLGHIADRLGADT